MKRATKGYITRGSKRPRSGRDWRLRTTDKLKFTPEQSAAIEDRGGALLVSAAAGSGKTRVLVERLLKYIVEDNADVDEFLMITYTRAAAQELKGRILDSITALLSEDPSNRRLRRQSELLRRAHISTIHSFCSELIRENASLLDMSPDFRVCDENEAAIIMDDVCERLLDEMYEDISPDFAALVDTLSAGRDDRRLKELIIEMHRKLQSHPYPEEWVRGQLDAIDLTDCTDIGETVWGRLLLGYVRSGAVYWRGKISALLDDAELYSPDFYAAYSPSLTVTLTELDGFIAALGISWDAAKAHAAVSFPRPKNIKGYETEKNLRKEYKSAIEKLTAMFTASSAELIADMEAMRPAVSCLLMLTLEFSSRFSAEKRRRTMIDFSDQEHLALKLLWDGGQTEIARAVSDRFREIMVDEYQDVNAVQELIFKAVSRGETNIFMVGDVKQSIYRFRLADPEIFLEKYRTFRDRSEAEDGEPRRIILPANFRSRYGVLEGVNFVFKNVMSEEFGGMEYTDREALAHGRTTPDADTPAVELDIIDASVDSEDGDFDEDKSESDRTGADAAFIAHRIDELLHSGMMIPDSGGMRPIRPSDIAILMRSVTGRGWKYIRELVNRGIPCSAQTNEEFFDTVEISVMVSLLAVIDNPRQDIPLISALRSPLFGFTADELSKIRINTRKSSYYDALCAYAETDEKAAEFLKRLEYFRLQAPELSSDRLLWLIYNETDALAIFGAMTDGDTRRANLMLLYDEAVSFERNGYKGLFAFSSMLKKYMETGKEPLRAEKDGGSGVHIMTIHKSKGLEFPVVFLADLDSRFNLSDSSRPLLFHSELGVGAKMLDSARRIQYPTLARLAIERKIKDETRFEELRVLYVAMTRAREKLIMCVTSKKPASRLNKILTSSAIPVPPQVMGASTSLADFVLYPALMRREVQAALSQEDALGELDFSSAAASVSDDNPWDVRFININSIGENIAPSPETEPEAELTPEDEPDSDAEPFFAYPHKTSAAIPSKITATELKGMFADAEAADEAGTISEAKKPRIYPRPSFEREKKPLSGAERGTAQHLALQYIDLRACVDERAVRTEIARLVRDRFITQRQADAVNVKAILEFLASPVGRRLLNADSFERELKFTLLMPAAEVYGDDAEGEILFQGVIDLCFCEGGEYTVIDFKTDFVTSSTIAEKAKFYAPQIESYAHALERMTKRPVKQKILYFLKLNRAVIVK